MKLFPANKIPLNEIRRFVIIFYIVGLLGFVIPFSFNFFKLLIPFAILISFYLLIVFHEKLDIKSIIIFFLIFSLGILVEIMGVSSGNIFGEYYYGNSLGLKIFNTPLIIGINWLFLAYTSVSIINKLKASIILKIPLASSLMLIYDLILEQVASALNMWHWSNNEIPLLNYISWFLFSIILTTILYLSKISTRNKLASILFTSQFVFFLLLMLIIKLNA